MPPPSPAAPAKPAGDGVVTPVRQPVPARSYAFPSGRFRISADSKMITGFETKLRCAPATLPSLAVRADGTFRLERPVAGVTVQILGGFADRRGASLTLRFRSPTCDSGVVHADAHLS
jgi:hypothetical protein